MNLSIVLGGVGVVVSTLFGVWGVYLALRKAKYPASLSFVHEQVIGLFADVASKLPNLSISYKNEQLDNNVILINGYIANDGTKDISPSMVERQLTAELPISWKWLECTVLSPKTELSVKSTINSDTVLSFQFGLFRRGESFSFQALIAVDVLDDNEKVQSIIDKISWNHRIADLGKIKSINLPFEKKPPRKYIMPILTGIIYMIMFFGVIFRDPTERAEINYILPIKGEYTEARLIPNLDGTAKIEAINSDYEEVVNLKDYLRVTKTSPKIVAKKDSIYVRLSMIALFLVGGFLMFYLGLEKDIKKWRIRKLIKVSNKPNKTINSL